MKRILTFIISLIAVITIAAQNKHSFSPKEFVQRQERFIIKEAHLTPEEADKFFPLFHEMNNQLRKKEKEIRELMRKVQTKKLDENEYKHIYNELNNLAINKVKTEQAYYKKILHVISIEKALRVQEAKRRFDRQYLKRMVYKGHNSRKGPQK